MKIKVLTYNRQVDGRADYSSRSTMVNWAEVLRFLTRTEPQVERVSISKGDWAVVAFVHITFKVTS